jgi:hypothetical protein
LNVGGGSTSDIRAEQEFLVAISPQGNRTFLGARGSLARDVAGICAANPGMVPAHLCVALDPLPAGLWVVTRPVAYDAGHRVVEVGRVAARRVVLADFARFGIEAPRPRLDGDHVGPDGEDYHESSKKQL